MKKSRERNHHDFKHFGQGQPNPKTITHFRDWTQFTSDPNGTLDAKDQHALCSLNSRTEANRATYQKDDFRRVEFDEALRRRVGGGSTEQFVMTNQGAKSNRRARAVIELVAPVYDTEFKDEMKKGIHTSKSGFKPVVEIKRMSATTISSKIKKEKVSN